MSNKNLALLGLAALVMVIVAVVQSRRAESPAATDRGAPSYLIQGLNIENVSEISVVGKGSSEATVLQRRQNNFVVANKDDYPAHTENLNDLITKTLDIKVLEKVTDNPENFEELGVGPNLTQNVVRFLGENEELIAGVAISEKNDAGQSYVRLISSDDVYVASEVSSLKSAALDYVERQILKVDLEQIQSVTVKDPNNSYTLISEPNSSEITLNSYALISEPNSNEITLKQGLPQGKQLKETEAKNVFSALTNVRFNDVFGASSAPQDLKFANTYTCRLNNPTVYTFKIAQENIDYYLKCGAVFTDTSDIYKEDTFESEEQLKKKEVKLLARDAVQEFNNTHKGWVYKISEYEAEDLIRKLNDILEDIPQEKETENSTETEQLSEQ
ncbi:DUF4340 domain-containing protein [Planctomycetota bacterium]